MLRDIFKDENYWDKCILETSERIKKFSDCSINEENLQRKKTLKHRLEMIRFQYIFALYSAGRNLSECKKEFIINVSNMSENWNDSCSYVNLLQYVSIAYLFNVDGDTVSKLVSMYKDLMIKDLLIEMFLNKMDNSVAVSDEICFPEIEKPLLDIMNCQEKREPEFIKSFIEKSWYNLYNDAPWFDSHKRSDNCYYGYWCFEVGALIKFLGIDDTSLKGTVYYPFDMVHFEDGVQ